MVQWTKPDLDGSAVMSKRKLTGNLPFYKGTAVRIDPPPHAHTRARRPGSAAISVRLCSIEGREGVNAINGLICLRLASREELLFVLKQSKLQKKQGSPFCHFRL